MHNQLPDTIFAPGEDQLLTNRQFCQLLAASQTVAWSTDMQGRMLYVNEAALQVWGYDPSELIGQSFLSLIADTHKRTVASAMAALKKDGAAATFQSLFCRKDGTEAPMTCWAIQDETEETILCIGHENRKDQDADRHKQELKIILDHLSDGFISLDSSFVITAINNPAKRFLNHNEIDLSGKCLWDLLPHAIGTPLEVQLRSTLVQRQPNRFTSFFPTLNAWYEIGAYPASSGLIAFFQNVTEQKKARENLLLSNERFLLAAKSDALYDWNMETNELHWGQGVQELFGYRADELQMPQWELALHEEDKLPILQNLNATLQDPTSKIWKAEYRMRRKDGAYCFVFERGHIVRDEQGKAIRVVGILQDITDRRNAEEELRRFLLIMEQTANAVFIADLDHRITWINKAFTNITGYSREEALGNMASNLLYTSKADPTVVQLMKDKAFGNEGFQVTVLNKVKDGSYKWCEVIYQPVFDVHGRVVQHFCILTDITDRKKANEKLQDLALVARSTDNSVILTDMGGKITWVNEAFTQVTGYTYDEAIGQKPGDLLQGPGSDQKTIRYMRQQIEKGKTFTTEILNYTKKGEPYWVEISCKPLYNEAGMIDRYFAIQRDITERKRLQQVLDDEKAKRLQLITAAAIAAQEKERAQVGRELHDNVNQVLTSVKLYQELILSGIGNQEELVRKSSQLLQESIDEIRSLSKRLSAPTLGNIKLRDSITELVETIAATNKFAAQVHADAIATLTVSECLHLGIYRILQEHLTNILKHADASLVQIFFELHDASLLVKVADDGVGFDTTAKSKGIGITNMRTRAESLQGEMNIKSAPGMGCVLELSFPLPAN